MILGFRRWPWRWLGRWGGVVGAIAISLSACQNEPASIEPVALNSRFTDEQPTLSGDGKLVAFITNRNGSAQIAVYNLSTKRFLTLTGLNQDRTLVQSPSLSRTGRYIVYLVNEEGRPAIACYDRAIQRSEILTRRYRYWVRNPKISPDGRYISFETARRGQWDVEVLDRGPNVELDIEDGTVIEP
ncbi:TolB family protein [Spirulina major]|uniref:TolB family protein n=1 Tax=Spirulina major TaxID=270636 RepID=UPI0009329DC6|nr:TolB family protein [Spirulina major]